MTNYLGQLLWWTVSGEPQVSIADLRRISTTIGIDADLSPAPIDVFRRTMSTTSAEYYLEDGGKVTLDLHNVDSQRTMLVRHIVRTVVEGGVTRSVTKVGECAFYKPPRNQPERARVRVTVFPEALPDRNSVEQFAQHLRELYDFGLRHVDAQAVRRLVRSYLASIGALPLDGTYFVTPFVDPSPLVELLDRVGAGSKCYLMPVVDDEPRRDMLNAAIASAELTTHQIGMFNELGLTIPPTGESTDG